MKYKQEEIDNFKSKINIVDVLSHYIKLEKTEKGYRGTCPFGQENNENLMVDEKDQVYFCFDCGANGDAIQFVMDYEDVSLNEALYKISQITKIPAPEVYVSADDMNIAKQRENMLNINRAAAVFYCNALKKDKPKEATDYLEKRGVKKNIVTRFAIGYAPGKPKDALYKYLLSKGFSQKDIQAAGLININKDKGYVTDRFWNRIMYPIVGTNKEVIGFGGRIIGDGKPKYINSQDTLVFDKGRNLYGLNLAQNTKRNNIIICEGYMDVIAMHQAGFDNAVASLGTALTDSQVRLLQHYTKEVYLAYDNDDAGKKAAIRAISLMKKYNIHAKMIDLKPYKDPDELIQADGAEAFEHRIQEAKDVSVIMEEWIKEKSQNTEDYHALISSNPEIVGYLADIGNNLCMEPAKLVPVSFPKIPGEELSKGFVEPIKQEYMEPQSVCPASQRYTVSINTDAGPHMVTPKQIENMILNGMPPELHSNVTVQPVRINERER